MDFLLTWDFKTDQALQVTESPQDQPHRQLVLSDRSRARVIDGPQSTLVWLGDLVLPEGYASETRFFDDLKQRFDPQRVLTAGGHFYCFYYHKAEHILYLLTGFAGILPVYYFQTPTKAFISPDPESIIRDSGMHPALSTRFVVEKILFNYPLFQHSLFEDIRLLPSHHMLQLDKALQVKRYFHPESLLKSDPQSIGDSLEPLSRFFRTRLQRYWPDSPFALSFTGGFDGRTLLACAIHDQREFYTYAFGASDSRDLILPAKQARDLHVDFTPIYLDGNEYIKNSLDLGREFIQRSAGTADMARAHYVYGVRKLSRQTPWLVTGNFGSELFRALHLTGEMIAYPTYLIFALHNPDQVVRQIKQSDAYKLLNPSVFKQVEEELRHDLQTFYDGMDPHMTLNQRFYMFVMEEVFRKYFGPEITMQSHYLTNRTPFLDFQFVQKLFSTQLGGIYNDFYEHNPVKRKKGQLLYARIIKDTHPQLYRMRTGKGYTPRDVLHPLGNINLAANALKKKLKPLRDGDDPFCVQKAFFNNLDAFRQSPLDANQFNRPHLDALMKESPESSYKSLLKTWSINWYIRKTTGKWSPININSSY